MTEPRITTDEARELLALATPGPWLAKPDPQSRGLDWTNIEHAGEAGPTYAHRVVASVAQGLRASAPRDAALIAAAPDLAADLLDARERVHALEVAFAESTLENGVLRAEISTLRKQIDEVAPVFMDAGDGAHYLNKLCPFCRTKSGRLDARGHAVWCPWLKNHEALQRVETEPQLDVDLPVLQHKEASHD